MADDITLGDEVEDIITGYKGIVIARTAWLSNCDRVTIQAQGLTKEGKPYESVGADIGDVRLVKKDPLGLRRAEAPEPRPYGGPPSPRLSGGPMPDPGRPDHR